MIKTIIKYHLQELSNATDKGIQIQQFNEIKPELRKRIPLLKKEVDMSSTSLNRVLSSELLLNFVNENKNISTDTLTTLLRTNRKTTDIEKAIHLNELDDLLDDIEVLIKNKYICSYGSPRVRNHILLVDVALYCLKYGYKKEKSKEVADFIAGIYDSYRDEIEKYEDLEDSRIDYIRFREMPYTNHLYDSIGHFKTKSYDFEFYQFLFDQLNESQVNFFQILYKPVKRLLHETSNKERVKNFFYTFFDNVGSENGVEWLQKLILSKDDIFLEHEVRKLIDINKEDSPESNNIYNLLYGENSPQAIVLNKLTRYDDRDYLRNFVKGCIKSRKKAFLRLLSENAEEFSSFTTDNILFSSNFTDIINLNTLNQNNFNSLKDMYNVRKVDSTFDKDSPLTFKEFEYLYKEDELDIKLFYHLMDLKVDERLRAIRELPQLKELTDLFEEEELVKKVAQLVRVKPMKKWLKEKGVNIKDGTDAQRLFVLLAPEKFEKFQNEIETGVDVEFLMRNQSLVKYASSLEQAKALFIVEDPECKFVLDDLKVSKEFIETNKSNIISFAEKGLAHVYSSIHEHRKMSSSQLNNLRLITKAELAGKLEHIKFADEDFELEIGLPVSAEVKSEWKYNRMAQIGEFSIQETYDYETTIQIGENPVRSCLSWDNGMYSRCLLSQFDTNKKVMIAKDRKGRTLSRAVIRLTKGANEYIEYKNEYKENKLAFKDIDGESPAEEEVNKKEVKENLVLFLERCYTSLDGHQSDIVKNNFIKLAQEKAKELGATLIVADDYYDYGVTEAFENFTGVNYYIFISYSKNGYQYLDSLTGQASESNEGRYRSADVLIEKNQFDKKTA